MILCMAVHMAGSTRWLCEAHDRRVMHMAGRLLYTAAITAGLMLHTVEV